MNNFYLVGVTYLSFEFQTEFGGEFVDKKDAVEIVKKFMTCSKKTRWDENRLNINISYQEYKLMIERTFLDDGQSSYSLLEYGLTTLSEKQIEIKQALLLVDKFFTKISNV